MRWSDCSIFNATGLAHYESEICKCPWNSSIRSGCAGTKLAEKVCSRNFMDSGEGAAAAFAQLIADEIGAAIVSNTVHGELSALLERVELYVDGNHQRVAAIIDSQVIGIEKPVSRPFLWLLRR